MTSFRSDADAASLELFQRTPGAMFMYDAETLRFLDVNDAAVALYQWSREEMLQMSVLDIVPPEDAESVRELIRTAGQQETSGPWRQLCKDGSERMVRIVCHSMQRDGRQVRMAMVTDITESISSLEALRRSEELFRTLCSACPTGVFRTRVDGYSLYANPQLAHSWGRTEEEMLGYAWMDAVHPDDLPVLIETWTAANRAGLSYDSTYRVVLPDGEIRLMHGKSSVIFDDNGAPASSVGTVEDITDRKRAEDALRISEAGMRTLTNRIPVALLYVDADGQCRRVNRTFEEMSGLPGSEITQMSFDALLTEYGHKKYSKEARAAWASARRGVASRFEKVLEIQGKQRIFETSYTPDFGAGTELCGITIMMHDVTERKELEEQFRHAQKMEAIGRLAGGIAHDFNNILSVMNGYAHLLQNELNGNERLGRMAAEIHRAGERAAQLTQQLLAFSRKQISQPRVIPVDDLLYEEQTMLRRLVGTGISIEFAADAEGACIQIDPHRFSQVLLNLSVNAKDAMPHGGKLTFRTKVDGEAVQVLVEDTGIGMPASVLERLFEPFFTTKESGKGTGLGLATAYGIVREAGGEISVISEEGVGTTFTLLFPLVRKKHLSEPPPQENAAILEGNETILLIEDDANIRFLLGHTLKTCGYNVVQAEDGKAGLETGKQILPTLSAVVSDAIMPGLSGQEVIANLRSLRPDLKAMLVSGHVDADPQDLAHDSQTIFLYKPVPPQVLTAELRRLLDGSPATCGASLSNETAANSALTV